MKEKILSVTKDDCKWQYFRAGGNGGQNRNKVSSACRVVHEPSGAKGECSEHREQRRNREIAFERMAKSWPMKRWINMRANEIATGKTIERQVEDMTQPHHLKVEVKVDGKWTEATTLSDD